MKFSVYKATILSILIIGFSGCASNKAFDYAKSGELDLLKQLVEKEKINVNMNNQKEYPLTLFETAVLNQKFEVADYLLKKGVDINEPINELYMDTCQSPLHKAVDYNLTVVKYLVQNGADIHKRDCLDLTPLMRTVAATIRIDTRIEIAKFLLDNGADINAKSDHPLFHTVQDGAWHDKMKEFLKNYKKRK